MVGLLGRAPLTSDIAFFLEIVVFLVLIFGRFRFARRGKIRAHGLSLAGATAMHTISVVFIMIPSLARSLDLLFTDLSNPIIILAWIHIPLGLLTLILAIYIISRWRFQRSNSPCYGRVRLMRPLWLLWILSLILGFVIYASIAIYFG